MAATLWAFVVAIWVRLAGKGSRGRVPIVASVVLALLLSRQEEPAKAGGEEMAEELPTSPFEYTFSPTLTALAEPERARGPSRGPLASQGV